MPNGAGRWPPPRFPVIEEEHADIVRRTHPLLALLAILCLGFVVAACGSDDEKSSSSDSSSSSSGDAPGNEIQKVAGAVRQDDHRRLEELHRAVRARRDLLAGARSRRLQGQEAAQPRLRADRLQGAPGGQGRRLSGVHRHRADLVLRRQDRRRPEGRQQGLRGREGRVRQEGHHRAGPDAVREHLPPRHDQGGRRRRSATRRRSPTSRARSRSSRSPASPSASSARTACSAWRTPTA